MSEFLSQLFSGCEEGFLTLCRFAAGGLSSTRLPITDFSSSLEKYIDEHRVTLYYNVGVTKTNLAEMQRGKKDDVACVTCLWMDIDLPKADSKKTYPPLDVVMQALADMPLKYTALIHTGGGLHVYWFLNEPYQFNSLEDVATFESKLSKPWAELFKAKLAKYGQYQIDSIHDVSRMLRIPGSWHKNGNQCVVREADYTRRYDKSDVTPYVDEIDAGKLLGVKYAPEFKGGLDGRVDLQKLEALCFNAPEFKKVWDRKRVFPSDSEADLSIVRHAFTANWSDDEIGNLLIAFNQKYTPERIESKLLRKEREYGNYIGRLICKVKSDQAYDPRFLQFGPPPPKDGEIASPITLEDEPPVEESQQQKLAKLSKILQIPVLRWIQVGREQPLFTIVVKDPASDTVKSVRVGGEAAVVDAPTTLNRRLYSELGVQLPATCTSKAQWQNVLRGLSQIVEVVEAPETTQRSLLIAGIRQYLEEQRVATGAEPPDQAIRLSRPWWNGERLHINMQDLIKHLNMYGGHKWNTVEMVNALTNLKFERGDVHYKNNDRKTTKSYYSSTAEEFRDLLT